MATPSINNPADEQQSEDQQLQELWKELDKAIQAQEQLETRNAELKERLPQIEATLTKSRGEAFKLMRNFTPQGALSEKGKSVSTLDLLVKESGVMDSYFNEPMKFVGGSQETAAAMRAREARPSNVGVGESSDAPEVQAEAGFLNEDGNTRVNGHVARAMGARQEDELKKSNNDPSVAAKHEVEDQLFGLRKKDAETQLNHDRRNPADKKKLPSTASVNGREALVDRLMEAPAREIYSKGSAPHFFNFTKPGSLEAGGKMTLYSKALVEKLEINEGAEKSLAARNHTRETQIKIIDRLSKGNSKAAAKELPQFDADHFEHFSKLDPSNEKDRALLAQASQMMQAGGAQDKLPEALKKVSDSVRAEAAKTQISGLQSQQTTTPKTAASSQSVTQPSQQRLQPASQFNASTRQTSTSQAPDQLGVAQGSSEKSRAAALTAESQAAKPDAEQEKNKKVYGKSTPEERARRAAQFAYIESKGLTSKSSSDEVTKAFTEFQEKWQSEQRAKVASQTAAAIPARQPSPSQPLKMR